MCLTGTFVASWSLAQKVAGSSPFSVMISIFVTDFADISERFRKNLNGFDIYPSDNPQSIL